MIKCRVLLSNNVSLSFENRVYMEQGHNSLAAALCLELGNALKKFERISEASTYYQRGAELVSQVSDKSISVSRGFINVLTHKIHF